jgi:hypothetical protein
MKPPKFHVGQAVVCVDAVSRCPELDLKYGVIPPKHNQIYHVRDVTTRCHLVGIRLVELQNVAVPTMCRDCGKSLGYMEVAFDPARFRPVELLPNEALAQLLEETLETVTT